MIRTEGIFKSFGDHEVLKGIDFTFEKSKTNLIIGKSGAGKTVLLKILVGLIKPTAGHVWYGENDLCALNKYELQDLRMQVGMLFQGNALFDSMTIEENIRFPMDMFTKMSAKEKRTQVDLCLERVSLEGVNDKYPSEISGGMQKRVGIARAIVLNPKYLFADEPNSGLDPKTAITIDELLSKITVDNNITTVINTHDMNSVMEIGENICLLHEGKLAWQGSNSEVLESPNQTLQDFIFASPFLQKLKNIALSKS
ncbi:MAG: ATP-binding cassette domain-containing protein [Saprospiraceae bacterium]|nr:ATP-binding cassette domain-containing protein [Bacteroidia bacterium]NNE16765.1 ATP-binding cassette domain-containing protein [Saprospiraceae bacterium]NNL92320.1 ATP-binding cassette domain-containing protein [Saprospiraceae bacterium]